MKNYKNRFVVSFYWRGDVEDERFYRFPTKEDAWAFVLGNIRKTIKFFEKETPPNKETIIDFDKVKEQLFEKGHANVHYCQNSAWWDNWSFHEDNNIHRWVRG